MASAHSLLSFVLNGDFRSSSDGRLFASWVSIWFSRFCAFWLICFIVFLPVPVYFKKVFTWPACIIIEWCQKQTGPCFNFDCVFIHCLEIVPQKVFNKRGRKNPSFCHIDRLYALLRILPTEASLCFNNLITGSERLSRSSIRVLFTTGSAFRRNACSHVYDLGGCYHIEKVNSRGNI